MSIGSRLFCFLIGMVFNRSRRSYYLFLTTCSYYLYGEGLISKNCRAGEGLISKNCRYG